MAKKFTEDIFDPKDPDVKFADIVYELVQDIRPQDAADLEATGGDRDFMIIQSIRLSDLLYVYRGEDNELLCILGICPVTFDAPGRGVWMLGTNAINKGYIKSLLFRRAKEVIGNWADRAGLLHNVVNSANTRSIAYLTRLGAKWLPESILGANGTRWCRFYIAGKECDN